jgi:hypothetical protein
MMIADTALSPLEVDTFRWSADWAWGLPLIAITMVIHAFGLLLMTEKIERLSKNVVARYGYPVVFVIAVGGSAMWAALLPGAESMVWAAAYRFLGAMPSYPDAALYSWVR